MPAESALRDRNGPGFSLIETLRWEPQAGFLRLNRHLARLAESARELGFVHDPAAIENATAQVAAGDAPLRVRLLLAPDELIAIVQAGDERLGEQVGLGHPSNNSLISEGLSSGASCSNVHCFGALSGRQRSNAVP